MVQSVLHIGKVLLLMVCLSMPVSLMAQDVQQSQMEMEQNQITISVSSSCLRVKNAEGLVLEVFSLTGEKVYSQRIEGQSKSFELGQLPRGYYIVKVGKFTRKIYLH